MVLPSGESNYFDFAQHHDNNAGSGINFPFTPDTSGSGLIATYGPSGNPVETKSTFAASDLSVPFSNAQDVQTKQIDDFAIFNTYVHYETGVDGVAVQIPFLSTYAVAPNFDPYTL